MIDFEKISKILKILSAYYTSHNNVEIWISKKPNSYGLCFGNNDVWRNISSFDWFLLKDIGCDPEYLEDESNYKNHCFFLLLERK